MQVLSRNFNERESDSARERERERETDRQTDRQSDGEDSSYCVFIVSNMYNKVILNIKFTLDYVSKPILNCYTVISILPFKPRIENLFDF